MLMTLQDVTVIKNVFLSGEYTTDLALHSSLLESGQMAAEPDIPSFFIPCIPSSLSKHGAYITHLAIGLATGLSDIHSRTFLRLLVPLEPQKVVLTFFSHMKKYSPTPGNTQ